MHYQDTTLLINQITYKLLISKSECEKVITKITRDFNRSGDTWTCNTRAITITFAEASPHYNTVTVEISNLFRLSNKVVRSLFPLLDI